MIEEWRTVECCPAYEVSSLGRVRRSLPGKRTRVGHILSTTGHNVRYLGVTLVFNGVRLSAQIHRLVCEAFHGPAPSAEHQSAHENGRNHDNRSNNLSWKLPVANAADRIRHGTQTCGEATHFAKLTEQQVLEIRSRHNGRRSGYADTAADYGVDKTLIGLIIRREVWQHI